MKKSFVIIFILISVSLYAQGIIEEKIVSFSKSNVSDSYDFLYDKNNGTYAKMIDDSVKSTNAILSNKGNSNYYGFIAFYNLLFDSDGNYYVIAGNFSGKDSSDGFLIKNGNEVCKYDDINPSLISDGEFIYFEATKNNKSFIVKYDFKKETLTEGKKYDYISLCSVQKPNMHEPDFSLQLSSQGQVYYVASLAKREFMVINDIEQKRYEYIELFYVTEDKDGNICYIAKDTDSNGTYSVIVQNGKEYGKCYFVSGPILFNNDNIPVYFASDSFNVDEEVHYLYTGNEKSKYYAGGLSNAIISKSGDVGFIAADTVSEDKSSYFVVVNGNEGKKYESIYNLIFSDENEPFFIAEQDKKFLIASMGKEYRSRYSNIFSLCISPDGKLCYVGQNFADSSQNKEEEYFYHVSDKVFGPYAAAPFDYEYSESSLFVFNESWRFAFVSGEYSSTSRDTILYRVHSESFNSEGFDYIGGLTFYDGELYYHTYLSSNNICSVYRNKAKLGGDFERISDFKLDMNDGLITFIGYRKNGIYFVKIDL